VENAAVEAGLGPRVAGLLLARSARRRGEPRLHTYKTPREKFQGLGAWEVEGVVWQTRL